MEEQVEITEASPADDATLVRHYLALWESYGTPPVHIDPEAPSRIAAFIANGRQHHGLKAFLARSDSRIAGSVACQLHISPFPEVIMPAHRLLGYVWSVYVEPDFRRKGVARRLMEAAIGHLKELGCTIAVLHSSDAGERLYEELGFARAKEMRLKL
jgi:ribosomal protein S18 acetylase RimI-like enzyme